LKKTEDELGQKDVILKETQAEILSLRNHVVF